MVAMTLSKHLDGFIDEVTLKDSVRGAIEFLHVSSSIIAVSFSRPLDTFRRAGESISLTV